MQRSAQPTPGSSTDFPSMALTLALLGFGMSSDGSFRQALHGDRASGSDVDRIERGYYEQIVDASRRIPSAVSEHHPRYPAHAIGAPFDAGELTAPCEDVREYTLRPRLNTTHLGQPWTTNSLGLRDREYPKVPSSDVVRIALVGDSIAAGWGVADDQGFEPLLERAMDSRFRRERGIGVEIVNFSVPGHSPGARWMDFRERGWSLAPNLVLFEATSADPGWDERRLRRLLPRGVGWDSPMYRSVLSAFDGRRILDDANLAALRSKRSDLLEGVYRAIVAECRAHGVPVVWLLLPRVAKPIAPSDREQLIELAIRSGFSEAIDVSDVFDGIAPAELSIAPADFHPNQRGHRLLADRLQRELQGSRCWRGLASRSMNEGGRHEH